MESITQQPAHELLLSWKEIRTNVKEVKTTNETKISI